MWRLPFLLVAGQLLAAILGATFFVLDVNSVQQMRAGDSFDWQWLALIAFGAFVALSAIEQLRLRAELNVRGRNLRAISRLGQFVNEGKATNEAGVMFVSVYEPEDSELRRRQRENDMRGTEWEQRVRPVIERECPEFLPNWDTTDSGKRYDCLMTIIKEIQMRL